MNTHRHRRACPDEHLFVSKVLDKRNVCNLQLMVDKGAQLSLGVGRPMGEDIVYAVREHQGGFRQGEGGGSSALK